MKHLWIHVENASYNFAYVARLEQLGGPHTNFEHTRLHFADGVTAIIHEPIEKVQLWIDEWRGLA